ncbi:MAG: rpiA [Hyphomicrobiales bacterium]|nr:rpiA [Hyphomicrobiales bacterium]
MTDPADAAKRLAAARALEFVRPGMRLGLGTGSTAAHFVALLGERVAQGLKVVGVPTSERTREQALSLNIPLSTLDETPELDLTVDGADEFDPMLRLIKGGGAALLREKIVAAASARLVGGTARATQVAPRGRFPLPVEVDLFGLESTRRHVVRISGEAGCSGFVVVRLDAHGHVLVTDGCHAILDCSFGAIPDPEGLARGLNAIPGVVEHGLFIGLAKTIIVADAAGVEVIGDLI